MSVPDDPSDAVGGAEPGASVRADRLAAEQAGTAYWRAVAAQRRAEAARVQHRPLVRVAVAVDRRTAALQRSAADRARTVGATGRRTVVAARALLSRRDLSRRRARLEEQLATTDNPGPVDHRTVLFIHLGSPAPSTARSGVTAIDLSERTEPAAVGSASPVTDNARINRLVAGSPDPLVCLLGPTSHPLTSHWLEKLGAPIGDGVVATAPLVVHPERAWPWATAHDLLVRWSGLNVATRPDGVPVARAHQAGEVPCLREDGEEVFAATSSGVMVDRQAWLAAGGLQAGLDLDAALFDLCVRLRRAGGSIRTAPSAALVDDRPVARSADLAGPLSPESAAWRSLVEDHGPLLARHARTGHTSTAPRPATIVLTTAVPSLKMADRSGDWHYAGLLAGALRRAGHPVIVQTADQADSLVGRACDLHLVLRGLEPVRRTQGQRHVIWVISHPEALDLAECDEADLVVVASTRFATYLRSKTSTPVEVLLQATEPRHFRPAPPDPDHRHQLTVVANSRGVHRTAVADAVAAQLTPAIYGQGWRDQVDHALIAADYADINLLPLVYASADIVLNDHWDTMRHWGFVSNRIFDVLACGTTVVSDHLAELDELFGDLVPTWRTPDDLRTLVTELLANPEATARRTATARELVLNRHTFDHRVAELAGLLEQHGLQPSVEVER